jgi:hypothetical protein
MKVARPAGGSEGTSTRHVAINIEVEVRCHGMWLPMEPRYVVLASIFLCLLFSNISDHGSD